MTENRNYVVIRAAPSLPLGFLPTEYEGRWLDLRDVFDSKLPPELGGAVAVPTGRFEVREDGAVAEVYEVRP